MMTSPKGRIAAYLLARYFSKGDKAQTSKLQQKLERWEARAVAARNKAAKAALRGPDLTEGFHVVAGKAVLKLSNSYTTTRAEWQAYWAHMSQAPLPAEGKLGLAVVSPEPLVDVPSETRCLRLVPQVYAEGGLVDAIDRLPDTQWVFFCAPGDHLLLDQMDHVAASAFHDADVILTDAALVDGDIITPLVNPGVNYLYALNVPEVCSRFFARAGRVKEAVASGAQDAHGVVLHLLQRAHLGDGQGVVRTFDRPVVEITNANLLQKRREALLTTPGIRLSGPNGPVMSDTLDAHGMGGVSVVICTKDKGFYIRQLVARLLDYPEEIVKDVIIVSNNTTNLHALHTLRAVAQMSRVQVLSYEAPFNFSAQSNLGASKGRGGFTLFLNDDIVPISDTWLEDLMTPFVDPLVKVTGPLLLYPDESAQHAGMVMGLGRVAGHILRAHKLPDEELNLFATAPRFVSCVTGAVLLVRRAEFDAMGGFDEALQGAYQDVDLCLRLTAREGRTAFVAHARLFHMESLSIKNDHASDGWRLGRAREEAHFHQRWGADGAHALILSQPGATDPFWSKMVWTGHRFGAR